MLQQNKVKGVRIGVYIHPQPRASSASSKAILTLVWLHCTNKFRAPRSLRGEGGVSVIFRGQTLAGFRDCSLIHPILIVVCLNLARKNLNSDLEPSKLFASHLFFMIT